MLRDFYALFSRAIKQTQKNYRDQPPGWGTGAARASGAAGLVYVVPYGAFAASTPIESDALACVAEVVVRVIWPSGLPLAASKNWTVPVGVGNLFESISAVSVTVLDGP